MNKTAVSTLVNELETLSNRVSQNIKKEWKNDILSTRPPPNSETLILIFFFNYHFLFDEKMIYYR